MVAVKNQSVKLIDFESKANGLGQEQIKIENARICLLEPYKIM